MYIYNTRVCCLQCKKEFSTNGIRTHLQRSHGTPEEKAKYNSGFDNDSLRLRRSAEKKSLIDIYFENPSYCKQCKTVLSFENKNKNFCSQSCCTTNTNLNRVYSDETKSRISKTLQTKLFNKCVELNLKCDLTINTCIVCDKVFLSKNIKKCCSHECLRKQNILQCAINGKISSSKRVKRSNNEIELFNLLSQKYECLNNKPMFNGWDADIIIPELKLTIHWNGPWHYRKITFKHSVLQVQNREFLKLNEIKKLGYNYIIVKDCDNGMTPAHAFKTIIEYISNEIYNLTII